MQSLSYVHCFIGFTFAFEIDHVQQGGERMECGGHSNSFGVARPVIAPPLLPALNHVWIRREIRMGQALYTSENRWLTVKWWHVFDNLPHIVWQAVKYKVRSRKKKSFIILSRFKHVYLYITKYVLKNVSLCVFFSSIQWKSVVLDPTDFHYAAKKLSSQGKKSSFVFCRR